MISIVMRAIAGNFLAILLLSSGPILARTTEPCDAAPGWISDLLAENLRGWHIVTSGDLTQENRLLWSQSYSGLCPGYASGDFRGAGNPYMHLHSFLEARKVQGKYWSFWSS